MREDEPVLAQLDIDTYQAELFPHGALVLTNNASKEEIVLSPKATYDLLKFLRQHESQLYRTICKPVEVNYFDDRVKVHEPIGEQGGNPESQENYSRFVYGDESDPCLLFVYSLIIMWVEEAYHGEALLTRIDHVPFEPGQREPDDPETFIRLRSWYVPQGTPDQAWRVTIWLTDSSEVNHIYVHRYGDLLYTGRSEKQSGRPHYLWIEKDLLK